MDEKIGGKYRGTSVRAGLVYGMAEFFGGGAFVIINTFFLIFLTKALGIPAALAGAIPMIGKVWDAVTDPMMGNITDRTRSGIGPKRLYILVGGILSGITFILLWTTIPTQNTTALFLYYVLIYCLFSTAFTVIMVPYNGLLPDMIDSYEVRSKFSSLRMIWSTLGAIASGLVPTLVIKDTLNTGLYLKVGILFGFLFGLSCVITFLGSWEKLKPPVKTRLSDSFSEAASVFKSRSFRIFIGIYLSGQCAMDFVSGMALYYVDDVINGYAKGYMTMLMGVLLLSQLVGMLAFSPVMSRISKRTALLIGAPIRLVCTLGLVFFSYENAPIVPILLLAAGIGIGNAATLTSIFAILADMADVDELITSTSRPGIVSGMATFARKISAGLSVWLIGILISLAGYDGKIAQSGMRQALSTQRGIAAIFVALPAILITLLLIFAWIFPIGKKEFAIVKREIARRQKEDGQASEGDSDASGADRRANGSGRDSAERDDQMSEKDDQAAEEDGQTTEDEKAVLERVTGFHYEDLWKKTNAHKEKDNV